MAKVIFHTMFIISCTFRYFHAQEESLDGDFSITDTDNFANPIYQTMMSLDSALSATDPQQPVRPPRTKSRSESQDEGLSASDNTMFSSDKDILVQNVDI